MTTIKTVISLLLLLNAICKVVSRDNDDDKPKKSPKYFVTQEVWFDVSVDGEDIGRFVVGLFGEITPMAALNFELIARDGGYKKKGGTKLTYKNSKIHRIVPDFIIQMGDVTAGDGTGGESVFGNKFSDENFEVSHRAPGIVSMANHGPDTNGSQFFILLTKARWLDGKHVAFGKVVRGMDIVRKIGDISSSKENAVPHKKVVITESGVEKLDKKYELSEEQLDSCEDI